MNPSNMFGGVSVIIWSTPNWTLHLYRPFRMWLVMKFTLKNSHQQNNQNVSRSLLNSKTYPNSNMTQAKEEFRYLLHLGQLSTCVLIVTKVFLVSYQDDGNVGTEVFDFWGPLLRNVFCEGKNRSIITARTPTFHFVYMYMSLVTFVWLTGCQTKIQKRKC